MAIDFEGVFPANVTPFTEAYEIDRPALERHVAGLAAGPGVKGIVCNGHAGEVTALSREGDAVKRALMEASLL